MSADHDETKQLVTALVREIVGEAAARARTRCVEAEREQPRLG